MRILFDQGTPIPLRLAGRGLAIVVLLSTSWPRIQRIGEAVVVAIEAAVPGGLQEIPVPE